ncbi:unnamed protein product [Phytophthora fragariaefolia]|uniref:Unnamed protein product n=1 Tax=Phytophthora fragariaefolia TaxID=1490495 RepID=A0A9W6TY35_9STRA|nr:unnamed protein product [Phytophthora fragariaefolia]
MDPLKLVVASAFRRGWCCCCSAHSLFHFAFASNQEATKPPPQTTLPVRSPKLLCRCVAAYYLTDADMCTCLQMDKNTGNINYTMVDIDRLLHLVEQSLPLGKDEWERLTVTYNSGRTRGSPERDFESLRRKFKVLYCTRKPTGMPNMPPCILKAKKQKQTTDEQANVIETDDEADRDQPYVEPDFSFEADPDDSFYEGDGGGVSLAQAPPSPDFQELLASPLVNEGLEAFARTPRPTPLRADQTTYSSAAAAESSKPHTPAANISASNASVTGGQPSVASRPSGKFPDSKQMSKYQNFSNHLGGCNLTDFSDTIGAKRALEEDKEVLEASYAKSKRIGVAKTTTALKTKLTSLENTASSMGESFMQTILLLREENERKAEARRAEEEQRRRDDIAAREARLLADKTEAEERCRQDKLDIWERARRDREETRARTQELMLIIQAIAKKS